MFSFRRVYAVAKREYLELRRDTLYVIMAFLSPIILFIPFAYGLDFDVTEIRLGICDMDNSSESRDLIQTFVNTGEYFTVKKYSKEYDTMDEEFKDGKLDIVIVIPHNFSRDLRNARTATVQILSDAIFPSRAETAVSYTQDVIDSYSSKVTSEYLDLKGIKYANPIEIRTSVWFNETLESVNFVIPPIIPILLYFLPPLISSLTIVKEKELGSIMAFYCSPITKSEYIIGKMIPYTVISYIDFIVLFTIVRILFPGIPFRGSVIELFLIAILYSIATTGVGLLLSVLMNSQVATVMVCFVGTMIPAFGFSGAWTPVSTLGTGAQVFSAMLPVTYCASIIKQAFLKTGGMELYMNDVLALALFAVLLPGLAILLFKKRL